MQVGTSTYKLGQLKAGDVLATFVGPLGKPLELDRWGTVALWADATALEVSTLLLEL